MEKNIMKKSKKWLFFITSLLVIFYSCGSAAPFKEKQLAEVKIQEAKKVDAENYAPEDLSSSEASYNKGEELIVLDKKSSSNKEALTEYLSAIKNAETAYDKSIDPYTKVFIDGLAEDIASAREEKVDIASQELFDDALTDFNSANDKYNDKNFLPAIDDVRSSEEKLTEAVENTRFLKEQTIIQNGDIEKLIEEAKTRKALAATPNEYNENLDNFKNIQQQNDEGYYPQSLEEYPKLKNNFQTMFTTIDNLKKQTIAEDNDIKSLIEEAKKRKALAATPKEYQQNLDVFKNIQGQNADGYYSKSLQEYPDLKENFQVMFTIIEEKRLLAIKEIKEAEERIEKVVEKNQGLEEEIGTLK